MMDIRMKVLDWSAHHDRDVRYTWGGISLFGREYPTNDFEEFMTQLLVVPASMPES